MQFTDSSLAEKYYEEFTTAKSIKFFTQMPDIVDHLTYIKKEKDGTWAIKRLTPTEKEVYRVIRRAAGNGVCWKSTETLAKEANCATGSVCGAKKTLQQAFQELDGNPLIYVEEKFVRRYGKDERCNGVKPKHEIRCVDITKWNNAHMALKPRLPAKKTIIEFAEAELAVERMRQAFEQKSVHNFKADSEIEPAPPADSNFEGSHREAGSKFEANNTPKQPYSFTGRVNSTTIGEAEARRLCLLSPRDIQEAMKSESNLQAWLERLGVGINGRNQIKAHSLLEIELAAVYTERMLLKKIAKGETKISVIAYFLDVLRKGYYKKPL